jgi:hypothetical protein
MATGPDIAENLQSPKGIESIPEVRRRIAEYIALPIAVALGKGNMADALFRLTAIEGQTGGYGLKPELGLSQKLSSEVQKAYDRHRHHGENALAKIIRDRFGGYFKIQDSAE